MTPRSAAERRITADRIRNAKLQLAESITQTFLDRHPDWTVRYGDRARRYGIEDACFHLDFLAAAIETGSPAAFAAYGRWASRMLSARGVPAEALEENLMQVGRAAAELCPSYAEWIEACVRDAAAAWHRPHADRLEPRTSVPALAAVQTVFAQAIRAGNRKAATNIVLQAFRDGYPLADIYADVVQESLYEIGRLWETNQITVAEEHMATAITQYVLAQLYPSIEPQAEMRGRMVITAVEGEQHQIGANMVADFLEVHGWNVRFLGGNTPHGGVVEAVGAHQATIVGISATMLYSLPKVTELTTELRQAFPRIRIILGGAAVRTVPEIAADAGADGWAGDLRSALAAVNALNHHSDGSRPR